MNTSCLSCARLIVLLLLTAFRSAPAETIYAEKSTSSPVVITGTVPDEATRAAFLARLQEIFGSGKVVDQLSVGRVSAPPGWSANVPNILTPQLKLIGKGQLAVDGTNVSIHGEVASENVRRAITNDFAKSLNASYVIRNSLRVTAAGQTLIDQVLANRVVEFEHGSALLTESGKLILDEIAGAIKKLDATKFEIIGHTDNIGTPARNTALSRSRADSVKTYLVSKGISPALIGTSGMGADQPVASNTTEEGRRKNRRIDFRVSQ